MRFTPSLSQLFNIRTTDRNRPITDLTNRLGHNDLAVEAEEVLKKLIPIEREVEDDAGRWYLTRIMPYRSSDDRIEGIVITFVEITERKRMEFRLLESDERNAFILRLNDSFRATQDPIVIKQLATKALGEQLKVATAGYVEVEADGETIHIGAEYSDGRLPITEGKYKFSDFGEGFRSALRAGDEIFSEDVRSDVRGLEGGTPTTQATGVRAGAAIPHLKAGHLTSFLT
jgi:hypothetical protein